MKRHFLALILCASLAAPAWAATGTMIKNDALRQSASASAASVSKVSKGASVEILARQGGWTQIRHAGRTGWVRILSVKTITGSAGGDALGLIEMGSAKRDPSRVVAVAGLRGLKEEEPRSLNEEALRTARFNANELLRLDQYISSRSDAEQFARSSGLRRLEVAYIALPKRKQESTPSNSPWGESGL